MTFKYKKAIKTILNFKKIFDKIEPKIPRKIVSDLGEFYVLNELEKRRFNCVHKGGQAGYDIYLDELDKRVEVRTSLLKNEGIFKKGINFFGWRVKDRNQKRIDKFDVLVCVALDDKFIKPKFYIFTHKEAFTVDDVHIGRFPNVQKRIALFENKAAFKEAVKTKPKLVTKFERSFNLHPSKFLNKWNKINSS